MVLLLFGEPSPGREADVVIFGQSRCCHWSKLLPQIINVLHAFIPEGDVLLLLFLIGYFDCAINI